MVIPRTAWRWIALTALWTVVGLVLWLMTVQLMLVILTPAGTWQLPGISKVTILEVDNDPQSSFTDIRVKDADDPGQGEEADERVITLLKSERVGLRVHDQIWILDNFYRTRLRPGQFRLSFTRLVLEFPEPLLALALFGIFWIQRRHRSAVKAAEADPNRVRTVLTDDFHKRAQRFADPDGK
jgi:hypothetical protein